ncbi:MAG: APC family permease [Formosimonas sp.]
MSELKKTLTLYSGTALFLNIVIGAGLLVLPGLAYQQTGGMAIFSWLLCALVALPLLLVFVVLGKHYPDSGGIAHYAFRAFGGWAQKVAAFLFLGAVVLGLPSIAMTGGYYLNATVPFSVHAYAVILIVASALLHGISGQGVARVLGLIGSGVIVVLIVLLVVSLMGLDSHASLLPSENLVARDFNWLELFTPFMMIFFAFTGWEVGSHSAEEFKNPTRDFPRAMLFSFVIATAFYVAIAWVVQQAHIQTGFESPFIEVTRPVLGESGVYWVSGVAVVLIFANLFGAIWGVSRLVYSLGRDEVLPEFFSKTRDGTPLRAIFAVVLGLLVSVSLDYFGVILIQDMLSLAGQNFLILYGLAASALFVLTHQRGIQLLAALVLMLVLSILYVAGVHLVYPIILIALASMVHLLKKWAGRQ